MKIHRPLRSLLALVVLLFGIFLSSCGAKAPPTAEKPLPPPYVGELSFSGRRYEYKGNAADLAVENDIIILKASGVYRLSGELAEGRIRISPRDKGSVRLVLDGARLNSSFGECILADSDTVLILESAEGSVNILSCDSFGRKSERERSACVYARGDILFCGKGRTVIDSDADAAVCSEKGVAITDGALTVSSKGFGIYAKTELWQGGGSITISYAKVGARVCGDLVSEGKISLLGGTFTALCKETALYADRRIQIRDCLISLDAPTRYKCERRESDKTVNGEILISK